MRILLSLPIAATALGLEHFLAQGPRRPSRDQVEAPLDDSSHAETAVAVIFGRASKLPSCPGHAVVASDDAGDDELDGLPIALRQRARSEHGVGRLS
jgi:hypothetical protein